MGLWRPFGHSASAGPQGLFSAAVLRTARSAQAARPQGCGHSLSQYDPAKQEADLAKCSATPSPTYKAPSTSTELARRREKRSRGASFLGERRSEYESSPPLRRLARARRNAPCVPL